MIACPTLAPELAQAKARTCVGFHISSRAFRDNYIDGRLNPNSPHLILVTAGGDKFPNPSDVSVIDNVLINGPTTRTWYLQDGSGPEPVGNRIIDAPESP